MAEKNLKVISSLSPEEVIVKSVSALTSSRWRLQSQSPRVATFVGRPKVGAGLLIATIVAFFFFIIPGIIMYFFVLRRAMKLQNIVITANPLEAGAEVNITYPKHSTKMIRSFGQSIGTIQE